MKNSLILIVLLLSSSVMAEDWSAQLQSPIPALRDKAEKQLIEMGRQAGVELPDASQPGLPADVKRRIERIRRAWDERQAGTFLEPAAVSNLPTDSLKSCLDAIEKQTGNPIDVSRIDALQLNAPIKSLKASQFWQAMDELTQQNILKYLWFERTKDVGKSCELRVASCENRIASTPHSSLLIPNSIIYPGPFRLELLEWGTTVRLSDPASSTIRTGLILAWEPRLRPIYIDVLPKMQYADGTVKSGESIQILAGEGLAKPIDFIFPLTSENGKRPATLSGDMSVVIAGEQKIFAFSLPSDSRNSQLATRNFPVFIRQDQAVAALKQLTMRASQLTTNIAIEFDESYNGLRSYMTWLNYNKAYVVDSSGKRYSSDNWETVWQSDRGAEVKYYFTVPSDANIRQIEYLSPTAIRRIDYSFKFEDFFPEKF